MYNKYVDLNIIGFTKKSQNQNGMHSRCYIHWHFSSDCTTSILLATALTVLTIGMVATYNITLSCYRYPIT